MSFPDSFQKWILESIPKSLETAFLWEYIFNSTVSLCNKRVYPFVEKNLNANISQGMMERLVSLYVFWVMPKDHVGKYNHSSIAL